MTIRHAASTNGHSRLDEDEARAAMYDDALPQRSRGGLRVLLTLGLVLLALVVVRRLNEGNAI